MRWEMAALVIREEPWNVPGYRCSSTGTPAWTSRRAYSMPSSRSGSNSHTATYDGGSPVRKSAARAGAA